MKIRNVKREKFARGKLEIQCDFGVANFPILIHNEMINEGKI